MDHSTSSESNGELTVVRKAYTKPTLQVYGTIAQLSLASTQNFTHKADNGFNPGPNRRT
jgi:hypothetical protein